MSGLKDLKIYTRKGDKGETSLIGGRRVPKFSLRVECYGTVDELNSVIGMVRDLSECFQYQETLLEIQDRLFTVESLLASDSSESAVTLPQLYEMDVLFLESEIDRMNEGLPVLSSFVLPGGHIAVSWSHIARTVCRRAERHIIRLAAEENVDDIIIKYINRLSDFLFVLARRLSYNMKVDENLWKARKKSDSL